MNSWDDMSERYQASVDITTDDVHYGPCGPGERELRLLGNVKGLSVLDLGCGGGQNSIALAKSGACVTGIDSSARQIDFARSLAKREGVSIDFVTQGVEALEDWLPQSYDIVVSCFCVEYIDLEHFFRSVGHVLKNDGLLVFCDLHPMVSGADVVGVSLGSFIESVDYFFRRSIAFEWRFEDGIRVAFARHHRTLEDYFSNMRRAGFVVEDLREPKMFLEECDRYPYKDLTLRDESEVWRKLPYTLVIKARRVPRA